MKLLKLEGSVWLFSQNGGCDENLIDQVFEAERISREENSDDRCANAVCRVPNCGDDCVWRASLVVSVGVWSIHRVLDLSRVESRPELWGKYTYVLNRLQVILLSPCLLFSKLQNIFLPLEMGYALRNRFSHWSCPSAGASSMQQSLLNIFELSSVVL